MSEPIGGPFRVSAGLRKSIGTWCLGAIVLSTTSSAPAGVIRHSTLHTKATVEIKKADPWSGYWIYALNHHMLKLTGPSVHVKMTLAADGTLPSSPFVEYMTWRESINAVRFDSFHVELAKMLHTTRTPTLIPTIPPETYVPPTGSTPILPPNFTPLTNPETLNPPHIPEPSTYLIAVGMIVAVGLRRRWTKSRE